MGRSLSPLLRQELANLDKDLDSRQSAMKALKTYAKHLDTKAIPQFLAEVSDTNSKKSVADPTTHSPSSTTNSGEFTISLYEVLARVHGKNIIPQIDNIMSTIMSTLSSSGGSFPLHQACSKVVPAIARYGIDHSTPDEEKTKIINSLCKPLCDSLMGMQESVASGAALCLKALVESGNWRFASSEMVNEVCLKVAGALHERSTQSNAHMSLVMALVKHNGLTAEAYTRSFVRSGLRILDSDSNNTTETNSQKRFSAIQMINFLMKFVDPRSVSSELDNIIEVLEKCQSDRMPFVCGAAFEALQAARNISARKGSRHEIGSSPILNLNFKRKDKSPCRSPSPIPVYSVREFQSPESQIVESSIKYDMSFDSPGSVGQTCNINFSECSNRRSNRRLWRNERGCVDVSLKDGLFLKACPSSKLYTENGFGQLDNSELGESSTEHTGSFSGFVSASPKINSCATPDATTPSPQRSKQNIGLDDIKICTTPRRLFRSLQNSIESNHNNNEIVGTTKTVPNEDTQSTYLDCNAEGGNNNDSELTVLTTKQSSNEVAKRDLLDGNESVSSTGDVSENSVENWKDGVIGTEKKKISGYYKVIMGLLLGAVLVLCIIMFMLSTQVEEDDMLSFGLVPT